MADLLSVFKEHRHGRSDASTRASVALRGHGPESADRSREGPHTRARERYRLDMNAPSAHNAACPERGVKPKLRGVSHEYAFFISIATGVALIAAASDA